MFKQLLDGWKASRLITLMKQACVLVEANRFDEAGRWLLSSHEFSAEIRMHRILLIDMITAWGIFSDLLQKQGHQAASERCQEMSALLQKRFDAGEYYPDTPGAKRLFESP